VLIGSLENMMSPVASHEVGAPLMKSGAYSVGLNRYAPGAANQITNPPST
jgi:hypothetical protein